MARSAARVMLASAVVAGALGAACSSILGFEDAALAPSAAGDDAEAAEAGADLDAPNQNRGDASAACIPDLPLVHEAGATATCNLIPRTDISGDPNNCGLCGHSCQGASCTAGFCSIAYLGGQGNLGFVEDGYAYSLLYGDAGVTRTAVDAAAGNPGTLLFALAPDGGGDSTLNLIGVLGYADGFVLLANQALSLVARDGGDFRTVLLLNGPLAIAIGRSGDSVDVADNAGNGSPPKLWRVIFDGGASLPLAEGTAATALATAASGTYWIDNGANAVLHEYVNDGGTTRKVLDDAGLGGPLVSDGQYVYWADSSNGSIWRTLDDPLGVASPELVSQSEDYPSVTSMAIDDGHVYWMAFNPGQGSNPAVFGASKCARAPASMIVATDPGGEAAQTNLVASDRASLFYHSRGQLVRVAK